MSIELLHVRTVPGGQDDPVIRAAVAGCYRRKPLEPGWETTTLEVEYIESALVVEDVDGRPWGLAVDRRPMVSRVDTRIDQSERTPRQTGAVE